MYSAGQHTALEQYGLTKVAFNWAQVVGTAAQGGSALRNIFLGAPGTLAAITRQAKKGLLFKKPVAGNVMTQGMYHNPFGWLVPTIDLGPRNAPLAARAPHLLATGLSVLSPVLTTLGMYQALKAPPEYRSQAVGNLLGNVVGSTVLGPFGAAGQVLGGEAGGALGSAIGKRLAPYVDPEYPRDLSVG